jgi:hypothetical protein
MEDEFSMFPTQFKSSPRFRSHAGLLAAAGLAFMAMMGPEANAQRAEGPFTHLAGSWSGGGTIATSNGTRERIRCIATYGVGEGGHALTQSLRCASDSYRFYVTSNVRAEGGRLTGNWSETTRGASGEVSGIARDSVIQATVAGTGFTAGLAISTHGSSQSVTIRPQGATDIVEVSVNLRRG